jgi:calcium/proton exchanger cax
LIGSVVVNLLLVLGASISAGGFYYQEQVYDSKGIQLYIGLLNLTVFSLLIPVGYRLPGLNNHSPRKATTNVIFLSRLPFTGIQKTPIQPIMQ